MPHDGDEVVQAYVKYPQAARMPVRELKAFKRVSVKSNDKKELTLTIPVSELQKWNLAKSQWEVVKGDYQIVVGGHSRDEKLTYSFKVQ